VAEDPDAICGTAVAAFRMLPAKVVRVVGWGIWACEVKEKAKRNKIVSRVKFSLLFGQGCELGKGRSLSPNYATRQDALLEAFQAMGSAPKSRRRKKGCLSREPFRHDHIRSKRALIGQFIHINKNFNNF
jgi:hypothetical protein